MTLSSTTSEIIAGVPCEVWVSIFAAREPDRPRDVACTITVKGISLTLAYKLKTAEMLIREDDILEPIDREIALSSAEYIVELDSLRQEAYNKLRTLESYFAGGTV